MKQFEPLKPGDKHGYLRVLDAESIVDKFRNRTYPIECACGKRFFQTKSVFLRSKSCGCASSPTFSPITQKRFRIVRQFLRQSPRFSSCGLARLLIREYPRLYKSFDSAYSVIRQIRGVNGNSTRTEQEFKR